ncbi:hypothetical protein [Amycolatopsis eburnea]|uniref:Uncharacterized protein n=1 Tax=Amycolatopsis eburnea TaxID=2267691 RepID=A0A3R9FA35_9PSEU|nr:hypothetical protein [Amycolatopsis eburnea]RSD22019.1 hypothetical protein EIY87_09390 [Amycolatopsis eburnea]
MGTVAEPYYVRDAAELAQKLALGLWVVLPREALGDDCDLDTWKAALRTACEPHDVDAFFVDIPRKDMTVAVNSAALPSDDEIHESVRRVELDRWLGRELQPELAARIERGE